MGASVQPQADPFADLAPHPSGGSDPFADLAPAPNTAQAILDRMAQNPKISPYALRQHAAILAANADAQAPKPGVLAVLGQMAKQTVQHPIQTVESVVKAPFQSAYTVGKAIGQPIANAIEPEAVAAWKAQGGQPVTGEQAAAATAQTLANAVAPGLGGLLGGALVGGAYGAEAKTPQELAANVLLGGGIGGALHLAGKLGAKAPVEAPAEAPPEAAINQQFAEQLQQGAEQAGTAPKRGAALPPEPAVQSASDFADMLAKGATEKAPKKVVPVEGLTSPANAVAEEALQNYYQSQGFVRRPAGDVAPEVRSAIAETPEALGQTPESALPTPDVALRGEGPSPTLHDPFADLGARPSEPLPSYPEGFAMGGQEGRIPEIPKEPTRGNPPVPSTFVTPDVARALGEERGTQGAMPDVSATPEDVPVGKQLGPVKPPFPGAVLIDGTWQQERRAPVAPEGNPTGMEIPLYSRRATDVARGTSPDGTELQGEIAQRPLRSGEPLINPRTWDQAPASQQALADALQELQAKGVSKEYIPIAQQMQQVQALAKQSFRDIGIDPNDIDMAKVRNMSGPQVLDITSRADQAVKQVIQLNKALEDPTLPAEQRAALQRLADQTRQQRDNLLEAVVVGRGQRGRDLNLMKQIALRSTDPDVWVHEARRIAGENPLSDALIARIRKLALAATEACA